MTIDPFEILKAAFEAGEKFEERSWTEERITLINRSSRNVFLAFYLEYRHLAIGWIEVPKGTIYSDALPIPIRASGTFIRICACLANLTAIGGNGGGPIPVGIPVGGRLSGYEKFEINWHSRDKVSIKSQVGVNGAQMIGPTLRTSVEAHIDYTIEN